MTKDRSWVDSFPDGEAEVIERLRRELDALQPLHEAVTAASATLTISGPGIHGQLLERILETAMRVISAQAGALFLVDWKAQELTFAAVLGGEAEAVKDVRIPLGHGFAGLVAVTGEPMAASEVSQDPRHASDIAGAVGYTPQSILCVPLLHEDGVVGVLELLDKADAPSFTMADMELLGLFGRQAAIAIALSRMQQDLAALLGGVVGMAAEERREAQRLVEELLSVSAPHRRALSLARLVGEIAQVGEREADACLTILQGFAQYLGRDSTSYLEGAGD